MKIYKFPDKWLFKDYKKSEIKNWIQQLEYFYFLRAWDGHNNERDKFATTFHFNSKEDLLEKLDKLGVKVNFVPANTPQPKPGVSYPSDELEKFKILVRQFPDIEQPGSTTINKIPCHIYIVSNYFQISVSGTDGNSYHVTNSDFIAAKKLELFFDTLLPPFEKDLGITQNAGCISLTRYPELYVKVTTNSLPKMIRKWWQKLFGI